MSGFMNEQHFPFKTSFWHTEKPPAGFRLEGDIDADIAVIGGGFAGLSSARAIHDADPSLRIVLIESEYIGYGASGRNGGFVAPIIHNAASVAKQFGWDEARWMARYLIRQAIELKKFIQHEGIECEYRPSPLITTAVNKNEECRLKHHSEELSRCGLEVEVLTRKQLSGMLGYPVRAAIRQSEEGFALLQPYHLARGLRSALIRRGVQVYERTRIIGFKAGDDRVELFTDAGAKITARKVVMATSAYTKQLGWGRYRLFPMCIHSYILATEPLDKTTLERLGPGLTEASTIDARTEFTYVRTYHDRLLWGGGSAGAFFTKPGEEDDRNMACFKKGRAEMIERFPFLANTRLEAAWGGPIQTTLTTFPIVRPFDDFQNVILNIGYSNGVPFAHLAGNLAAGLVLGSQHADPDAERLRHIFNTTRLSPGSFLKLGLEILIG